MLTSQEKEQFATLIQSTKGLSAQGNKARCTVTLSLSEVESLKEYGATIGLGVSAACKRIVQDFIAQIVAQKNQTN
jgi:hypothetical protein